MASNAGTLLPRPGPTPLQVIEAGALPSEPASQRPVWKGMLLLGLAALAYAGFLTQGEHLFDNDYDWIASARIGWIEILGQVFNPISEDWGFENRPVQVLCFKALYALFGYTPVPYYAFKALLFSGVVCSIAFFCLRAELGPRVAFTAAGIFTLSSPVFSSLLWISDFELLAQLTILAAFGSFLAQERRNLYDNDRYRFYLYQAGIFLLLLLGHHTKGSAKLIPAILFGYLLLHRRHTLKRYLPLLGLMALAVVPFLSLDPVPPFAPFAQDQSQGWMWKPANLTTLAILLVGNAHPFAGTAGPGVAYSLLGVLCPVLLWAGLAATGLLVYRWREHQPLAPGARAAVVLTLVWLCGVVLSFSAFPRLPLGFMARYVTGALVPASILVALLLSRAAGLLPSAWKPAAAPLLALIVLAHGAVNFGHVRYVRESFGQIIVAYDRARSGLSKMVQNANVLLIDLPYSYARPLDDGNHYIKDLDRPFRLDLSRPLYALIQHDGNAEQIDYTLPVQKIRKGLRPLVNKTPGYRMNIRPVRAFHGLTDSIYDQWIYRSTRSFLAVLFHIALEPLDPQKGGEK